ncbi:hypothetical protein [Streptomyces sp. M1013]|uniref:hypothetical protein n=1 Tax=Streptomyces sp. M1013 TaxID=549798 RepID=UPI00209B2ED9|nr:hypothetical protein [Streptomyces sp. M1013]
MAAQRSTAGILDAAVHVRAVARSAMSGATGVGTVLAALSEVMEYDHASLARWDPLRGRHTTLAGSYPEAATAYIETRLHHDPVFPVLRDPARGGLWLTDVPRQLLESSPGFQQVLSPLGVEDGVAQCLFADDGRYVGMLNVSTRRPRRARPIRRAPWSPCSPKPSPRPSTPARACRPKPLPRPTAPPMSGGPAGSHPANSRCWPN